MYDTRKFVSIFENEESEELLDRLATRDLTDDAKKAIAIVLERRGFDLRNLDSLVSDAKRASFRRGGVTNECDFCGKTIRFGLGVNDGEQKFCGVDCFHTLRLREAEEDITVDAAQARALDIKKGGCPKCMKERASPEIRTTYWIWSAVFISSWNSESEVVCNSCARKANAMAALACLILGWWSPWGLFLTPVQIAKNLREFCRNDHDWRPSEKLVSFAKMTLAEEKLRERNEGRWKLGP